MGGFAASLYPFHFLKAFEDEDADNGSGDDDEDKDEDASSSDLGGVTLETIMA